MWVLQITAVTGELGSRAALALLVLRGHVDVLGVVLLGGDAPSVDVVAALLLLLALWSLLLQLLTLVLGPPVLEPHLHLQRKASVQISATLVTSPLPYERQHPETFCWFILLSRGSKLMSESLLLD